MEPSKHTAPRGRRATAAWRRTLCALLSAFILLSGGVWAGAFSREPDAWAAGQVKGLEDAGLLQNLWLSGTAPDAVITRGQFCQLLVNLIHLEASERQSPLPADYFEDIASTVSPDSPGGRYDMYYAAAYGLTEGVNRNGRRLADCGGALTREQAAKMMCALLDALEHYAGVTPEPSGAARSFADAGSISPWAADSAARAASLGMFQGDQAGRFNPQKSLTWQEACVLVDRSYQAAEEAAVRRDAARGIGTLHSAMDLSAAHYLASAERFYLLEHYGVRSVLRTSDWEYGEDASVKLETFRADGTSAGVREIPMELSCCTSFYEGEEAYYLAFGQQNLNENDSLEVYRIVQYDKDWNRLGAASITGRQSFTTVPYRSTSHTAMAEENGTLILHTARQRYTSSDGIRHQSNLTVKIRTSDMSVQSVSPEFPSNHVSHSFAQYVRFDGGLPVYADQGDGYPRGFVLNVEGAKGDSTEHMFFPFHGAIGDNDTNARPGGLGVSADCYLFAGASSPQKGNDSLDYCNAFLAVVPKDGYPNAKPRIQWLTNFPADGREYVAAVYLVQMNNNTFVVMWQTEQRSAGQNFPSFGSFQYAVFDGQGNPIGSTVTKEGFVAPCADPTVIGSRILWARPELDTSRSYMVRPSRYLKLYELEIDLNQASAGQETSLTLRPGTLTLAEGETAQLDAVVSGGSAGAVTYRSSDRRIASVDAKGAVRAVKAGTAQITSQTTIRGRTYEAVSEVTVTAPTPTPSPTPTPRPTPSPTAPSPTPSQNPGTGPSGTPEPPASPGAITFGSREIVLAPNSSYSASVTLADGKPVSGQVTWSTETPDLLSLSDQGQRVTVSPRAQSGTGTVTAECNGQTARLTVHIVPTRDQVTLSTQSLFMNLDTMWGTTKLYVFNTSKFYGQDYTVTWSVDDPTVVSLEEQEIDGYQAVRFAPLKPGSAVITCRVTLPDGTSAETYCTANVYQRS